MTKILQWILYFSIVLTFSNCSNNKEKIKVVWNYVDYSSSRYDSVLFEKIENSNSIVFRYFSDFTDLTEYYEYEMLNNDQLVISKDTLIAVKIFKLKLNLDSINILKYENLDPVPGGLGCWIFSREYGMMGNGLYVGEKMIISDFDGYSFCENQIVDLMSFSRDRSVPPPPKEILESLELWEKPEVED